MTMPARPATASDADYARLCVAHSAWQATIAALHAGLVEPGPEREAELRVRELASAMRMAFRDYQLIAARLGAEEQASGIVPPENER